MIVRIWRGRYRGRTGRIAGTLEDRAAKGVTRAVVHVAGDVEVLPTSILAPAEPDLFEQSENKNAAGTAADGV